jgi:TonB family protein
MRGLWIIALTLALVAIPGRAQQATQTVDTTQPAGQSPANWVNPPKALNHVEAQYPNEARRKHISGLCLVSLTVNAMGNPKNIRIVHCSDPSFEKNSLAAVEKYRFEPATALEGIPVPAGITVEITYHLNGGKALKTPLHLETGDIPPK